jgi:hypothetical protein
VNLPFGYENFNNLKVEDLKYIFKNCKTLIYNLCNLIYFKNKSNMNFYKNNINKKFISYLTNDMEIHKMTEYNFTSELKHIIRELYIELLCYFKNDLSESEIILYIKQILTLEFLIETDKNMKQEYKDTIETIMDTIIRNEDVKLSIESIVKQLKDEPELKLKYIQQNKSLRSEKKLRISDYIKKPEPTNIDEKNLYKIKQKIMEINKIKAAQCVSI